MSKILCLSAHFNNAANGLPAPTIAQEVNVKSTQITAGLAHNVSVVVANHTIGRAKGNANAPARWETVAEIAKLDFQAHIDILALNAHAKVINMFKQTRIGLGLEKPSQRKIMHFPTSHLDI